MNFNITVFTPTYNRVSKLHRVYNSLKNQTLKHLNDKPLFEWLIIDDGSNDKTHELIQRWQQESNFPIRYFHQGNQGKMHATQRGIELAESEFFLIADSDDAFLPETIETFYHLWKGFTKEEQNKCGGISVLCQDQHSNPVGKDYPAYDCFIPIHQIVLTWADIGLGETWALLKIENLKKSFSIPPEAKSLKFIPESFFWTRMALTHNDNLYVINKRVRIYYRYEDNQRLSENIRSHHSKGFEFESLYFINHYPSLLKEVPKLFLKHLVKYAIFSKFHGNKFQASIKQIDHYLCKGLFALLYLPALLYSDRYLKGTNV